MTITTAAIIVSFDMFTIMLRHGTATAIDITNSVIIATNLISITVSISIHIPGRELAGTTIM